MHNFGWIVGKSGDGECFGRWGEGRGKACVQLLAVWGDDAGGMEDGEGTVLTRKQMQPQFTRLLARLLIRGCIGCSRCRDVGGDAGERMRGHNGDHAGDARDDAGET